MAGPIRIKLSGDQQAGSDVLLLSGDMQTGGDAEATAIRAVSGALAAPPASLAGTGEADDPTIYVSGDLAAGAGTLDAAGSVVVSATGSLTAGAPSLTHRVATDTIEVAGALQALPADVTGAGYLKPLPTFRILLSGDMQGGTDTLLLSGDLQVTGFDHEKHRPARPRRTQRAIFY